MSWECNGKYWGKNECSTPRWHRPDIGRFLGTSRRLTYVDRFVDHYFCAPAHVDDTPVTTDIDLPMRTMIPKAIPDTTGVLRSAPPPPPPPPPLYKSIYKN